MSVNAAAFMNKLQFLKDNGIVVDTSIMFAVFMAAIEAVLTEKWAYHFNQVFDEIKQSYPPSHKWTIDDFNKVVDKLGTADAKRDLQAAPAPEDLEETANAVTTDPDVSSLALSVLASLATPDDYSTAVRKEKQVPYKTRVQQEDVAVHAVRLTRAVGARVGLGFKYQRSSRRRILNAPTARNTNGRRSIRTNLPISVTITLISKGRGLIGQKRR